MPPPLGGLLANLLPPLPSNNVPLAPPPSNIIHPNQQPENAVASSSHTQPVADPTQLGLSLLGDDNDNDIEIREYDPKVALYAKAKPAIKIAGSHRLLSDSKGKGKARAVDEVPSKAPKRRAAAGERKVKKQRGRAQGIANYSEKDIDALLGILELSLPIGGQAWIPVELEFRKWAIKNRRPVHTAKSLEGKFKQVYYIIIGR